MMDGAVRVRRRGFTAYETLVAVAVLAVLAAAMSSALSAGQQQAQYGQEIIAANTLARDLLAKVLRDPTKLTNYHGYSDGPGDITDEAQQLYPAKLQPYMRNVTVVAAQRTVVSPSWPAVPAGFDVTVTVSRDGRQLAQVKRFVPVASD